ncbi:hypothetical protein ACFYO1_12405 [Nocardia sp. NPDC006044]|uniref:hypothetical protein n=1 Tax=Nocardia sp. NPDC006044 TaxID=3364306 RepID=UPI00367D3AF1
MREPSGATRVLRTVSRRVALGAFALTVALIALLAGEAILSVTGLTFDPHGYGVFAGILCTAALTPIALALWLLYRLLR